MVDGQALAKQCPPALSRVALLSNPELSHIDEVVSNWSPDALQFHGDETPAFLQAVKARFPEIGLWKAIGIAGPSDLDDVQLFERHTDLILCDAKPPAKSDRGGGHGNVFDWSILGGMTARVPWILAGGLTPENVANAIQQVGQYPGFTGVDVSSGVEGKPGQKDPALISDFIGSAKAAMAEMRAASAG